MFKPCSTIIYDGFSQFSHCVLLCFLKAPVLLLRMPHLAVAVAVELLTATLFPAATPLLPASRVVPNGWGSAFLQILQIL